MLIKKIKQDSNTKSIETEKHIYSNFLNTIGCSKYKSSVLLNLYNNYLYKRVNNLNQLSSEYNKSMIKFITFNFGTIKKDSIQFNNKKISLFKAIKNNK